jgi:hypothetical protein
LGTEVDWGTSANALEGRKAEVILGGEAGDRDAEQADKPDASILSRKMTLCTCTTALQQIAQSNGHFGRLAFSLEARSKIGLVIRVCTDTGSVCPA